MINVRGENPPSFLHLRLGAGRCEFFRLKPPRSWRRPFSMFQPLTSLMMYSRWPVWAAHPEQRVTRSPGGVIKTFMKKKIEVKRKTVANPRDEVASSVGKDRVIFFVSVRCTRSQREELQWMVCRKPSWSNEEEENEFSHRGKTIF